MDKDGTSIRLSVLDRLLDNEPDVTKEAVPTKAQQIRQLQQNVLRDLEDLLNTRRRIETWSESLNELDTSLLTYGLNDVSDLGLASNTGRETIRRLLETVLRQFEVRFKAVKVALLENKTEEDRTLRFRIDAMLNMEPDPLPVTFDSELEPHTASFSMRRA